MFHSIIGWIHDPAVDVTEFLQGEKIRGMLGTVEDKRCGPVQGNGTSVRRWIRFLTTVEAECFYVHEVVSVGAADSGAAGDWGADP